jgi:peroxiredoxin
MNTFKAFLILLLSHGTAAAQTTITLILPTAKNVDKLDVFDLSQQEFHTLPYKDTTTYHFKKNNIDAYNLRCYVNGKRYWQQIWLDTGHIVVKAHLDSSNMVIDTVINAPAYYAAKKFSANYSALAATKDSMRVNAFLLQEYERNINNPFSYFIGQQYIVRNQNSREQLIRLKMLADLQGEKFSWFLYYKVVAERLNSMLSKGQIDPGDFVFYNATNKPVKLQLTGADYFVLDFWNLACAPCLKDHIAIKPKLKALQEKGIAVIGLSNDDTEKHQTWLAYLNKHQYTWQNLRENKGSLSDFLGINARPAYVIIDKQGKVVGNYNQVSEILKKYGIE